MKYDFKCGMHASGCLCFRAPMRIDNNTFKRSKYAGKTGRNCYSLSQVFFIDKFSLYLKHREGQRMSLCISGQMMPM